MRQPGSYPCHPAKAGIQMKGRTAPARIQIGHTPCVYRPGQAPHDNGGGWTRCYRLITSRLSRLFQPNALLFEPVLEVAQIGIEHLIIVIGFEFLDLIQKIRLTLEDLVDLFLKFVPQFPQV